MRIITEKAPCKDKKLTKEFIDEQLKMKTAGFPAEYPITVYCRVYDLLEKFGLNIKDLGAKANVSATTITGWKLHIPRSDQLYKVAKFLGTSVEYLLTGCEQPMEYEIEERYLLSEYKSLSEKNQQIIKLMIEALRHS